MFNNVVRAEKIDLPPIKGIERRLDVYSVLGASLA